MRYYFEWMIDHRFTDFLTAKRDLFLFPPDEQALRRFHDEIRALLKRVEADAEMVKSDAQRAFFLRRLGQELEPLLELTISSDLAQGVTDVEAHLDELKDQIRAYTK